MSQTKIGVVMLFVPLVIALFCAARESKKGLEISLPIFTAGALCMTIGFFAVLTA